MRIPLFVCVGYGFEHPVFKHAKDLWYAHRGLHAEVADIVFYRTAPEMAPDEFSFADGEYVFGPSRRQDNSPGSTVRWDTDLLVDRQIKLYRKLLEKNEGPFWVYTTTVTSVLDLHALRYLANQLECANTYAGHIEYAPIQASATPSTPSGKYLRFASGAGTLLSSDLVREVLAREHVASHELPNDLWLAMTLRDVPRTPLLRHDILDVTAFDPETRAALSQRVLDARAKGHFHFRVKSGRWEAEGLLSHKPEHVDPLVLNDVLLAIQALRFDPGQLIAGWKQLQAALGDFNGQQMLPIA
jgi:hypothetical protein